MNIKELISTLKTDIIDVNFAGKGREWNFRNIRSPFSRLYLITGGEAYVTHNRNRYYLRPGVIHLIPCFSPCDYICHNWFEHYYIHFTSRLSGNFDIFNIGNFSYQIPSEKDHRTLFKELCDLFSENKNNPEEKASAVLKRDALLRILLCPFLDSLTDKERMPPDEFIEVLDYIDKNLHQPVTLNSLAKTAALHPNYFSDKFNNIFGMRPIDYLNRKRIDKAQLMILSNAGTIKEISYMTGFRDVAYFSRVFCKYSGVPPSRYKKYNAKIT